MKIRVQWSKLQPALDPKHGKPCARSSHGVSAVQKATRLIIYGGEHVARTPIEASESPAWAVDDLQNKSGASWRRLEFANQTAAADSAAVPPSRIAHAQAVHDDKYVYIFGGRAGITMEEKAMNDMWMLDCSGKPGTETWSQVVYNLEDGAGQPPEARSFHRMICIGSSLYVFGGCSAAHGRLADLHRFDLETKKWQCLATSDLRGRGGPNLIPFKSGACIGVVGGFAGEETADGQVFDIAAGKWSSSEVLTNGLQGMRPRSVCVSGSFPSLGCSIVFGGEVDPSDRGHEGAGGFENDIVVLDEESGALKQQIKADTSLPWPRQRGWSDSAAYEDQDRKEGHFFVFGGLSGDDTNPERLDDLWRLNVEVE